jgi:hypothetical protein
MFRLSIIMPQSVLVILRWDLAFGEPVYLYFILPAAFPEPSKVLIYTALGAVVKGETAGLCLVDLVIREKVVYIVFD